MGLYTNFMQSSDTRRFWSNVQKTDSCWLWMAAKTRGYGHPRIDKKHKLAHRFAYELIRGPIPQGMTLDHLCKTHACVNPAHLEPVPLKTNLLRGLGPPAINARKTVCKSGHPLIGDNLIKGRLPIRRCLICTREYQRLYREKSKDRFRVYGTTYRKEHREQVRAHERKYYVVHRDEILLRRHQRKASLKLPHR